MKSNSIVGIIVVLVTITIGLVAAAIKSYSESEIHENIHYHSAFQIFVNGELQDYSGLEYMNFSTCDEENVDYSIVQNRIHLHEQIGDVAHVHAGDTTWRDLFISLDIEELLDNENQKFYYDGAEVDNLLDQEVGNYEWVVFVFGDEVDNEILQENKITGERIEEVEAIFETCGI